MATKQRQVVTPIKAVLNHAARRGWCDQPKFEKAPAGRKRTEWLSPDEADRQIAAAPARAKAILTFLYCNDARVGEWSAWNGQMSTFSILEPSCATPRMDRIASSICRRAPSQRSHPFPTEPAMSFGSGAASHTGRPTTARGRATAARSGACGHSSLAGAGVARRVTPHAARHTWAPWHYAVHRDPMRLRDDGGWKSLSQVERYAKLAPQGLAGLSERSGALVHQRCTALPRGAQKPDIAQFFG